MKALYLNRHPERRHAELIDWFREKLKHNLEWLAREFQDADVTIPKVQKERLYRVVRPNWYSEMRYDVRAWKREESERVFIAAGKIFQWVSGV